MITLCMAILECLFDNFEPDELYIGTLVLDVLIAQLMVCLSWQ